jgi:hypothetical protein
MNIERIFYERTFHGFRVQGFDPAASFGKLVVDTFDLRQVAIECARTLASKRWRGVEVFAVFQEFGEEELEAVEWRAVAPSAPTKRRKRVSA